MSDIIRWFNVLRTDASCNCTLELAVAVDQALFRVLYVRPWPRVYRDRAIAHTKQAEKAVLSGWHWDNQADGTQSQSQME